MHFVEFSWVIHVCMFFTLNMKVIEFVLDICPFKTSTNPIFRKKRNHLKKLLRFQHLLNQFSFYHFDFGRDAEPLIPTLYFNLKNHNI